MHPRRCPGFNHLRCSSSFSSHVNFLPPAMMSVILKEYDLKSRACIPVYSGREKRKAGKCRAMELNMELTRTVTRENSLRVRSYSSTPHNKGDDRPAVTDNGPPLTDNCRPRYFAFGPRTSNFNHYYVGMRISWNGMIRKTLASVCPGVVPRSIPPGIAGQAIYYTRFCAVE